MSDSEKGTDAQTKKANSTVIGGTDTVDHRNLLIPFGKEVSSTVSNNSYLRIMGTICVEQ